MYYVYIYIMYLYTVLCTYIYIYMYKSIPVGLVEIHIIGNPAPIFRAQVTPSQSFGPPTDSDVAADHFLEIRNWVDCHPMYTLVPSGNLT